MEEVLIAVPISVKTELASGSTPQPSVLGSVLVPGIICQSGISASALAFTYSATVVIYYTCYHIGY